MDEQIYIAELMNYVNDYYCLIYSLHEQIYIAALINDVNDKIMVCYTNVVKLRLAEPQ